MGKSKPARPNDRGQPAEVPQHRRVKRKGRKGNGPVVSDPVGDGSVGERATENAYFDEWTALQRKWPQDMQSLFTPQVSEERRAELFELMAEEGEPLREKYAWAIPDERAIRVAASFSPLVEVGAGKGYWAKLMRAAGADVLAYDVIGRSAKRKGHRKGTQDVDTFWSDVLRGGPEVLQTVACLGRALFLCYPDEYEVQDTSLGLDCLTRFSGDTVIHVGELFGDCINLEQAPWGRTSGADFQCMLATNFHCIIKVPIPTWPMSRDTLSVWRRTQRAELYYGGSSSEDGSVEVETWASVPLNERMPLAVSAPCAAHHLH